jgi:threonine aldolase
MEQESRSVTVKFSAEGIRDLDFFRKRYGNMFNQSQIIRMCIAYVKRGLENGDLDLEKVLEEGKKYV